MKQNSVLYDSCLGLAIAAMAPLVIGTDLIAPSAAEAAVMVAAGPDVSDAAAPPAWWWDPLWGVPFEWDMIITMHPAFEEWGEANLKRFEDDDEGEVSFVTRATVDVEKHYEFAFTYHSESYEVDFFVEPSDDLDGEFTEGVYFTGTLQYKTEYWGVSFHNEFAHEAPAVISVTTVTLDLHGPAPDYNGEKQFTFVFPMLEFETRDGVLGFLYLASNAQGGAGASGNCQDVPEGYPCYEDCPSLNGCLTIARSKRNTELDKCGCDLGVAFGGAAVVLTATGLLAIPTAGAIIPFGVIASIMTFGGICDHTHRKCERGVWADYRHDVCVCWVNNIAQCDENSSGIPAGICPDPD